MSKNNEHDDKMQEYIKESLLIPSDKWESIPINSNICYIKKDGKFVKGGYVKLIYTKNEKLFLVYSNKLDKYNNDKYYKEFTINLASIDKIYKKIDQSAIMEYEIIKNNINKVITEFSTKLEKLDNIFNKIDDIEKKIVKLETNHYKIVKLIKKLHNINTIDNVN